MLSSPLTSSLNIAPLDARLLVKIPQEPEKILDMNFGTSILISASYHSSLQWPSSLSHGLGPLSISVAYGQKTRNRFDSYVYNLAIAHTSACLLPTLSGLLDAP